jgi:hypothetical protein
VLEAIVDAVRAHVTPPARVLPRLAAYARVLRIEARWLLAADAFATILANATGGEPELVITAAYHRGYCLRMAGQLEAAAASYDEGRLLAASAQNEAGVLEADVSHATLAIHRGNLPAAEALLDGVIDRANPATCARVLARAFHERAGVAARRGRPEEAVVFAYRALPLYETSAERDRVLGDIATALGDAGHHEAAWDGHLLLAATAQEQETRWVATVNLIELAALRGNERLFDRFRAELAGVELPTWLLGHYHLFVGAGYARFGHRALAVRSLCAAERVARQCELNEIGLRAERLLADLESAQSAESRPPSAPRSDVAEVIAALRSMRVLSGVVVD